MPILDKRPTHTVLTQQEAQAFIQVFEDAFARMTPEQLDQVRFHNDDMTALVISFDMDCSPFLGYTRGHNSPDKRTPLRGAGRVLALACAGLKALADDPPGGRIFFTAEDAYRVVNREKVTLCTWVWPGENANPVKAVLKAWSENRARRAR